MKSLTSRVCPRAHPVEPRDRDSTLAGLAGSALERRFRHWHGLSGRRYLVSVFPLGRSTSWDDAPRFEDSVVMAVAREADGSARVLCVDETGALPDLFYCSERWQAAVTAGANEVHVHLLAESAALRAAAVRDLAAV